MKRLAITALTSLFLAAAPVVAQPSFDKTFIPDTIGPASVSTLRFDIEEVDYTPVTDLAFTDVLPAGVVIADLAGAVTDCSEGTLSAPTGGSTISFSGGKLGAFRSCSVSVNVTSSTIGTHMNVSGDLTSSGGNSGTASDDLIVSAACPGFTKSFSPDTMAVGQTSTLTFLIDNTLNGGDEDLMSFIDNLPDGLVIATPANVSTDCERQFFLPTVTANPGSGSVSLNPGFLAAGAECTVEVDVTATNAGPKSNLSEQLNLGSGTPSSCGKAVATLDVERKFLTKVFPDDPVPPGGTVTLEFTMTNFDRVHSATDISFTDDLDASLSGLEAVGLPLANPCGAGSQLSGTDVLSLTGGTLGPGASCTFGATLQVPSGAAPGTYTNMTSAVVTFVDGGMVEEDAASDRLVVSPVPLLTKSFVDDPIAPGGSVTLRFSVTNSSPTSAAIDIAFEDVLETSLAESSTPADGFCGPGSTATFIPGGAFDPTSISIAGGNLAAAASCVFDFILDAAPDFPGGTYVNTTGQIAATVDGEAVTGNPATDSLEVVAAPNLRKDFTDDPVLPGGSVMLEFTLEHPAEAPGDATAISFTDDLDAVIAGLAAVGLPMNDICGPGSQVSGTSEVTFSGGSLVPGGSCTFSIQVEVPTGLNPGNHTNTTSEVSASSLGLSVSSPAAVGDLEIGGLEFSKTFTDDPALAFDTVTLEFTIENLSASASVTDIFFFDNLDATLSGLEASGLPVNDICGPGSEVSGTSFIVFSGGNLGPLASCTFPITLQLPNPADVGDYSNVTSQLTADFGGSAVTVDPAADTLTIVEPLSISKQFLDDPVAPGDSVVLEFTLGNFGSSAGATSLAFSDDLDSPLSGLVAVGLPASNICGPGSNLSGTDVISFTGGSLASESSCTFEVTLQVPAGAPLDTTATNTTSSLTGMVGGIATTGDPATDQLTIALPMCAAVNGETELLQSDTLTGALFVEVCDSVEIGPDYEVAGPNGDLTVRAGHRVVLKNGASVTSGGTLRIGIDPALQP